MTIDHKIAKQIKALILAPNNKTITKVGNTHIQSIDGVIAVFINGKLIFSYQKDFDSEFSEIYLISAMATKRLNALAEAMGWEFSLAWHNNKPHYQSAHSLVALDKNKTYSVWDLRQTAY